MITRIVTNDRGLENQYSDFVTDRQTDRQTERQTDRQTDRT